MEIVLKNTKSKYYEIFSLLDFDNIHETFKQFSFMKGALEAKIFAINESISSHQLSNLKNHFDKINIRSLKINSTFVNEQEIRNNLLLLKSTEKDDVFYKGTVRSGDRISSNGNLCIIGDVNPGAIVSAKKNIYVWGKLLGIAFAGKNGDNKASIAALYLKPLQLRIADVIAIGPKDKPKSYYPEIAVIDEKTIAINPFLIEN